jgi:hypothetical protein
MDGLARPNPLPGRRPCLHGHAVREPCSQTSLLPTTSKPRHVAPALSHARRRFPAPSFSPSSPGAPGVPPQRRWRHWPRQCRRWGSLGQGRLTPCINACTSALWFCFRPCSAKRWPQSTPSKQGALRGSFPPVPRGRSLPGPGWACQRVGLRCCPALEGVRPKPGPNGKRGGPRTAGCVASARGRHGTFPSSTRSTPGGP